jgi:hypothetical protein
LVELAFQPSLYKSQSCPVKTIPRFYCERNIMDANWWRQFSGGRAVDRNSDLDVDLGDYFPPGGPTHKDPTPVLEKTNISTEASTIEEVD